MLNVLSFNQKEKYQLVLYVSNSYCQDGLLLPWSSIVYVPFKYCKNMLYAIRAYKCHEESKGKTIVCSHI